MVDILSGSSAPCLSTKSGELHYRWQIELYFKRLKSLLDAGHMPKSNDASAKGWMQAKMLSALLLERIMLEAGFFPPGDTACQKSQWALLVETRDCLKQIVAPGLVLGDLIAAGQRLKKRLAIRRKKRPMQMTGLGCLVDAR